MQCIKFRQNRTIKNNKKTFFTKKTVFLHTQLRFCNFAKLKILYIMKNYLKKNIFLILIAVFIFGCQDTEKNNTTEDTKTQNYYLLQVNYDLDSVTYVLAPSLANYKNARENGLSNTLFVFYPREFLGYTDTTVLLNEFGDTVEIPNSLIIPMHKGETAQKGDLVLTWWQKGTGMQRGIVLNDEPSTTPIVYYIDNQYTMYSSSNDINFWIDTLKENSFIVVKDSIMPGRSLIYNDNLYLVISQDADKIVASSWSGTLKVIDKDSCMFVPFGTDVEVGDSIYAPYIGIYFNGKVIQKWADIGKIKAEIDFLDTTIESYVNIPDIIKY